MPRLTTSPLHGDRTPTEALTVRAQEQRLVSRMEELDLGGCFGEDRLDEPMTQEQFLQQTPAR